MKLRWAMRTVGAADFKAKCLSIMDEVQARRETVVITKRGKPVAKLVPAEEYKPEKDSIFGFMKGGGKIVGDIVSPIIPEEEWDNGDWDRYK